MGGALDRLGQRLNHCPALKGIKTQGLFLLQEASERV